jgi:UDP-3-O-[3-hydroxymyristoyl] glucosamine N-acyltransferase
MTIQELAQRLGCEFHGDPQLSIVDVQPLPEAGPQHLSFATDRKQLAKAEKSKAGALIVPKALVTSHDTSRVWLLCDDAQASFVKAMLIFRPQRARTVSGISPAAFVSPSAAIGRDTNVYPGAFIGAGAVIGDGCDIGPGAVVGPECRLGANVTLHPNAVLYHSVQLGNRVIIHANAVIGADGFGYRFVEGHYERIPHTGTVIIEDDVEIGACTTIDRAMVGATRVGAGTKLDNLIMIGHNCSLGKHNAFASQVGLAGSVSTGDYVRCAGHVGIADHLHMGKGSTLGAKAGVMDDIPENAHYIGAPAVSAKDAFRQMVLVAKLPETMETIKTLSKKVAELEQRLADQPAARESRAA